MSNVTMSYYCEETKQRAIITVRPNDEDPESINVSLDFDPPAGEAMQDPGGFLALFVDVMTNSMDGEPLDIVFPEPLDSDQDSE